MSENSQPAITTKHTPRRRRPRQASQQEPAASALPVSSIPVAQDQQTAPHTYPAESRAVDQTHRQHGVSKRAAGPTRPNIQRPRNQANTDPPVQSGQLQPVYSNGVHVGRARPPRGPRQFTTADRNIVAPADTSAAPPQSLSSRRPPRGPPRVAESANLIDRISTELRRGYECMVCMSDVKHFQSVWSCATCFRLFHLRCMHEWIHRSTPTQKDKQSFEWRCPGCQYVYIEPELPKYKCFCGRTENPAPSRQSPFSCGEPCTRVRTDCPHPCVLQCHPGSCPPCTSLLPKSACFCGSNPADGSYVRCGDIRANAYSCGGTCNRLLNCGVHRCEEQCHDACKPCHAVIGTATCACGHQSREILCGSDSATSFSCGESNLVQMDCGVHSALKRCGDEDRKCPYSPSAWGNWCACRTTPLSDLNRKTCTDPIPSCSKPTVRTLPCGHSVEEPCSLVTAESEKKCVVPVPQFCRCSKSKRTVPCWRARSEEFTCAQPCRTYKTCTKCRCDIVCCPYLGRRDFGAETHICLTVCGKTLNCGIHRCDDIHHLGNCVKCRVIARDPLSCNCGKSVIQPPFACGTLPPVCHEICNKQLPCGHRDLSRCHTEPNCAPCSILVSKPCAGGHQPSTKSHVSPRM